MKPLTQQGLSRINELANQFNVSSDAVLTLLEALVIGNSSMAQFNHPDLGGSGQWMLGGMTMVGDMFNHSLKAKVDGLCFELSNLLNSQPFQPVPQSTQTQNQGYNNQSQQQSNSGFSLFIPGSNGNWWPDNLGIPSSVGASNNVKYAYFPGTRRLAIYINGDLTIYDTLHHNIGGVSQQQGLNGSIQFTSQYGNIDMSTLPKISDTSSDKNVPIPPPNEPVQTNITNAFEDDIFLKIEKLADLKSKGILTEEEFVAKKTDLLGRL